MLVIPVNASCTSQECSNFGAKVSQTMGVAERRNDSGRAVKYKGRVMKYFSSLGKKLANTLHSYTPTALDIFSVIAAMVGFGI
jgi:hypothetical protein